MTKIKHKIIRTNDHINLYNIRDFLPIGSIVKLTATGNKKYLIFRLSANEPKGRDQVFDYMAVDYPEGTLVDETTIYFNHNEISEIVHIGYVDDDYKDYIDMIAAVQKL